MADIELRRLTKHYRVHKRPSGMLAALRSLVRRKYEIVRAVEELSFTIEPGERVGFLGPNGAGKTTTLKVLAGLLHPTSGEVRVVGHVPQRREVAFLKQITLVMGQKQQLLWDLPPAETFTLNRAIYEVPKKQFDDTMAELYELAAALLHRPRILFLDEPTIGLDVSMQASMRQFIRSYNERYGATVLLTSHYMVDVTALCPRVVVIDHGKLLYDGNLSSLVKRVNPDKLVSLKLSRPVAREDVARFGEIVELGETMAKLRVGSDGVRDVVSGLLAGLPIADLTVEDPPLEDVMRQIFAGQREEKDEAAGAEQSA